MIGPLTSEITKKNREKIERDFFKKVEEITLLYASTDVSVPARVQLEFPNEVVFSFEQIGKKPPVIARKKRMFMNILKSIATIAFLYLIGHLIYFFGFSQSKISNPALFVILIPCFILLAVLFSLIGKQINRYIDKYLLSVFNNVKS